MVKAQCGIPLTDTNDDALIDRALAATTIKINEKCLGAGGLSFYLDAAPSARVFEPRDREYLAVHDIGDPTSIVVAFGVPPNFTSTVSSGDFEALPLNAVVMGRAVHTLRHYWALWPLWPGARVQVTTRWGWPAVPDTVPEAQVLWTTRLFDRRNSPNGIANQGDFGPMRVGRMDPDIVDMLSSYSNPGFA